MWWWWWWWGDGQLGLSMIPSQLVWWLSWGVTTVQTLHHQNGTPLLMTLHANGPSIVNAPAVTTQVTIILLPPCFLSLFIIWGCYRVIGLIIPQTTIIDVPKPSHATSSYVLSSCACSDQIPVNKAKYTKHKTEYHKTKQ